jgi:signal peptidase I
VAGSWTVANSWPADDMEQTIPPNQYFVMGDNRNHSSDSPTLGYIARSEILGRLLR